MTVIADRPRLWRHQQRAIEFAHECWHDGHGALLALDRGCGKTRVALELIERDDDGGPALVLCPKSVVPAWVKQAEGFDGMLVVPLLGTSEQRATTLRAALDTTGGHKRWVFVTNYEAAAWESRGVRGKEIVNPLSKALQDIRWRTVVCDESHAIKAVAGATNKWVRRLRTDRKLALSGTPMPHAPIDILGQSNWLMPMRTNLELRRKLGVRAMPWTKTRFVNRFCTTKRIPGVPADIITGYKNQDELAACLDVFQYAVKAADVLDLPPVQDVEIPIALSPEERRAYDSVLSDMLLDLDSGTLPVSNALHRLLVLQQITSGAVKDEKGQTHVVGRSKLDALIDFLGGVDEPVVCFGRFRHDLDNIAAAAKATAHPHFELSGRKSQLGDWQTCTKRRGVLGVQMQSGSSGIDLTRARLNVYVSTGFSFGEWEQSRARTHRPGQTRNVVYYRMVAQESVDEHVCAALRDRGGVIESVVSALKGERGCKT